MSGVDDWLAEPPVPEEIKKVFPGAVNAETEQIMGFCETDNEWYEFERGAGGPETCPKCGAGYSHRIGFQLTSKRTWNKDIHGKKKLPNKK